MEKKHELALYIAYYFARFNKDALKNLGYNSWNEAFTIIAEKLGIKKLSIRNRRDEFDPLFSYRAGWYKRPMSPSRTKVANELQSLDEIKIRKIVSQIISGKIKTDLEVEQQLSFLKKNYNLLHSDSSKKSLSTHSEKESYLSIAKTNNWTKEELILALYWYCTKIPFSKIKYTRPEVIELAGLVGRTPSAAAFKLVNFARLDPVLQQRGVKGMSQGSKAEEPIWNEFYGNWDKLAYTAEKIIAGKKRISIEKVSNIETSDLPRDGKERLALVNVRINHKFFSDTVKLSYNNKCCLTGLAIKELLVASHIKPWSKDLKQAANPENGLCLNVLHDKAFDRGLITLSEDLRVILSPELLKRRKDEFIREYFISYQDKEIVKPTRFMPNEKFLQYHRKNVFIR